MPLSHSSPRVPPVSLDSLRAAAEAAQEKRLESQRATYSPGCPICQLSPHDRAAIEHEMSDDTIALAELTASYNVTVKDVLRHAQYCLGNLLPSERDALTVQFAHQIVSGLQHSIHRAREILDELYDAKGDDGQPLHRDAKLAMAYNQLAKTQSSVLDGVIAAADRKRIADHLMSQGKPSEQRTILDLDALTPEQLEALDAALGAAEDNS